MTIHVKKNKSSDHLFSLACFRVSLFHWRASSFPRMADWAYMRMLLSGKGKQQSIAFQSSHKLPPPVGISFHALNGKLMAVLWLSPLVPVCSFQKKKKVLRALSGRANNGKANFHALIRPRHQCDQEILKVLSRHRGDGGELRKKCIWPKMKVIKTEFKWIPMQI